MVYCILSKFHSFWFSSLIALARVPVQCQIEMVIMWIPALLLNLEEKD